MVREKGPPTPARGSLSIAQGILVLGGTLFIAWNLLTIVIALVVIGSTSPAFTFSVMSTNGTAVPASIAPDAFGYFREATFSSSAFSWWPHAWNTFGILLGAVTSIAVTVLVLVFARSAAREVTFRSKISRGLASCAIIIGLGGTLSRAALLLAQHIAYVEVAQTAPNTLVMPTTIGSTDWMPLLVGVALALLAATFRFGERLQRDTEGLV
jgi:hypothetical protein